MFFVNGIKAWPHTIIRKTVIMMLLQMMMLMMMC